MAVDNDSEGVRSAGVLALPSGDGAVFVPPIANRLISTAASDALSVLHKLDAKRWRLALGEMLGFGRVLFQNRVSFEH